MCYAYLGSNLLEPDLLHVRKPNTIVNLQYKALNTMGEKSFIRLIQLPEMNVLTIRRAFY